MTEKKVIDWRIVVGAIAGLTIIEVVALIMGQNGWLMSIIIGAICAFAGLSLPQLKTK